MTTHDSMTIRIGRRPDWLLALVLLLIQAGLIAHQIEHDFLNPHDVCVLCAHADQQGHAPVAAVAISLPFFTADSSLFTAHCSFSSVVRAPKPPARAPPLLS